MYIHPPLTKIVADKKRAWDGASLHVAPWTETSNDFAHQEAIKPIVKAGLKLLATDDYDH
jgi:hypothetical protein